MNLIPEEQWKGQISLNFAPMIDFLFVMLAFFATLAITRVTLFDTNLELVQLKKETATESLQKPDDIHQIHLSVSKEGSYKWITDVHEYPMSSLEKIQKELLHELQIHQIPVDKSKTKVLLHIDKNAPWDPIAKLIFSIREVGFDAYPIYDPEKALP